MNINDLFPSKYVKAADLKGQEVPVTIMMVQIEEVEQGKPHLPVAYFNGMTKGLVLNKTNATTIAATYGEETDYWAGKSIVLYPDMTNLKGEMVPCIRVKVNPGLAPTMPPARQHTPSPATPPAQSPTVSF